MSHTKLKRLAAKLKQAERLTALHPKRPAPQPPSPPIILPAPLGAPNNANDPTSKRLG